MGASGCIFCTKTTGSHPGASTGHWCVHLAFVRRLFFLGAIQTSDSDMSNTNGRSDMPAEEQEPAMPVRPRPDDIAMYNAWARRNGRPLWGAGGQSQAPAAPAQTGGPNRIRWGRRGASRSEYGQVTEGEGGGWRRGTFIHGKTIKAYRTNGQVEIVAIWISNTGTWKTTRAGMLTITSTTRCNS